MPSLLIRHRVEVQPVAELLVLDGAQEPAPVDTQRPGPRHDALPLGQDVVTFADVGEAGQWRWVDLTGGTMFTDS